MIEENITLLKQQCLNIRHNIYTEEINKVPLSANDDKRIILEDGMHTLAYGHYICLMGF